MGSCSVAARGRRWRVSFGFVFAVIFAGLAPALLTPLAARGAVGTTYLIVDLGAIGNGTTVAYSVNQNGDAAAGYANGTQAFRWVADRARPNSRSRLSALRARTTVNDNAKLTLYRSGTQLVIPDNKPAVTYPAGTYYFTKFDIGSGNHVYFDGPTLIYLDCPGKITSTLAPTSLKPIDLAVKVVPNNNWTIDAGGVFYGSLYNPTGDVHHHNGGISYGSVISDLLCFRQTSQGHQDLSLGKYAATVGVSLVK